MWTYGTHYKLKASKNVSRVKKCNGSIKYNENSQLKTKKKKSTRTYTYYRNIIEKRTYSYKTEPACDSLTHAAASFVLF